MTACLARAINEGKVIGIERIPELVRASKESLQADCPDLLESGRLVIKEGNGWKGCPEEGPFDAIHVGAAAEELPIALVEQLTPGGVLGRKYKLFGYFQY